MLTSTRLNEHLATHCGDGGRVTVFWSCGDRIQCTTGKVVDLFDNVIIVVGFVPTARESLAGDRGDCRDDDCNSLELATFIDLDRVCAVVAGLPPCREACPPRCCKCEASVASGI